MMKIIDTHCHIYPEKIAHKAVDTVEAFYDRLPRDPFDGTAAELVRSGHEAGIGHFVVFSVATTPQQVSSINRFIAREVAAYPGEMTGLGAMHLESDDYERDLQEIEALGLKGVKLHPDIQKFEADEARAMKVYEMCEERMPICIHAGDRRYNFSGPERMARIAENFPHLRLICAHMGGWSVWEQASEILWKYDNILVDCSSSLYWLGPERSKKVIRRYGADRVLFGTDYPFWPQKEEIQDLCGMGLKEEELEKIFWKNAAELYHVEMDGAATPDIAGKTGQQEESKE